MANIVKLTGCKEVSHDIYAYFTCDAEKALKAIQPRYLHGDADKRQPKEL